MTSLKTFFRKDIFFWILLIILIPSFFTLLRPGFFPMHDDLQAFRIHQMNECFKDFQIPCRWIPDMGYQYGYPQFNFYPPSVYYLGEVFHLIGFQFIDSVKLLFISGFILSALGMYLFLKSWLSKWSAFIGAVLYTYVPYKAVDVYVRGAMNEFWALVFFPFLFWSSYKLVKTGQKKYVAFFAIFLALLLLTHNLMVMIFAPFLGIWILIHILLEKKWKVVLKFFIAGLLGVGLAAFFTAPVFLEKDYAHLETLVGGYFDYRQHFVNINQLFILNDFDYGSSQYGDRDDMNLSTGQVLWITASFAVLLSLLTFKRNRKIAFITLVLAGLELLVLFMMHQKSSFIWSMIKPLEYLQFPWRFLSVSVFLLSVLGGIAVYLIEKGEYQFRKIKLSYVFGIFLIIALFILYLPFFQPRIWLNTNDKEKFSEGSWEKQLTISIFDYLPIYPKFPPTSKAPDNPETLEGLVDFRKRDKGSDFKYWEAFAEKDSVIRIPMFDFPWMTAFIDGEVVPHKNDDCRGQEFCLGLVTVAFPSGYHSIKVELKNTPVRSIGNIITLISVLVIVLLFLPKKLLPKFK